MMEMILAMRVMCNAALGTGVHIWSVTAFARISDLLTLICVTLMEAIVFESFDDEQKIRDCSTSSNPLIKNDIRKQHELVNWLIIVVSEKLLTGDWD